MKYIIFAAALLFCANAHAQSFLEPWATSAVDPREIIVTWEPVGEAILLPSQGTVGSAYYQQTIHCVVTAQGVTVGEERDYPIRWREGTPRDDQLRYCQQMADDYMRYVIDENVRPRESLDRMTADLDVEIRAAWDRFIEAIRLMHDPIEPEVMAMIWRSSFEEIRWIRQDELAVAMARSAGCEDLRDFWTRIAAYRPWL
jgi:hypothetical protein